MLSAESAAGQYPVEAVATMNRIAEEVESDPIYRTIIHAQRTEPEATGADAIAAAARQIAETLDLAAIVCWTFSGSTALARRARAAAAADRRDLAESSPRGGNSRSSGACIASSPRTRATTTTWSTAPAASPSSEGFAKAGQRIIIVAGVPLGTPGATNMVRIAFVGSDSEAAA